MPRKAKPTPGETCDLHLRDLRRAHGRPPPDVPIESNDSPPQIVRREEPQSGCSSAIGWL